MNIYMINIYFMLYENSRVCLFCLSQWFSPGITVQDSGKNIFLIKPLQSYYMTQSDFHRASLTSKDLKLHRRSTFKAH